MEYLHFMDDPMLEVKKQVVSYEAAMLFVVVDKNLTEVLDEICVQNVENSIFIVFFIVGEPYFILRSLNLVPENFIILISSSFPFTDSTCVSKFDNSFFFT